MTQVTRVRANLLCGVAPGGAAEAAVKTTGASDNAGPVKVEDVVVSASKRETRLPDAPVAINVLNTKALDRYDAVDRTATGLLIPQLSIDHAISGSDAIITIRGIGATSIDAAIEQKVILQLNRC